jgi:hypothetical protein
MRRQERRDVLRKIIFFFTDIVLATVAFATVVLGLWEGGRLISWFVAWLVRHWKHPGLFMLCLLSVFAANAQHAAMPNLKYTPGEVRTTDTKEVCSTTTKTFRLTTESMKRQVCVNYGLLNCPHEGKLEIDHLIPLELGGADAVDNLWPQPAKPVPGYKEKDKLENKLHELVCNGKISLIDAQALIRTDWFAAYKKYIMSEAK